MVKEVLLRQFEAQACESQPPVKHLGPVEETTPEPISGEEWDLPTEFADMLTEVTELLNKSADVGKLKYFLKFLCHPRTCQRYLDMKLYEHCVTPRDIIMALFPQYVNYMHTHLLRGIVEKFGNKRAKSLLKKYEDNFPRKKPLKQMPDPLSDYEVEACIGTKMVKVVYDGDANVNTTTMEDVERVKKVIENSTNIDRIVIVYANQMEGSVVFTFLIPEIVVSSFSYLGEDSRRDLSDQGILRIEVNDLVIDLQSLQAVTKTDICTFTTSGMTDTSQAKIKTDTSQAETKTDNLRTEIESDTSQAETKTDNLRTEIESDTSQAETKTDNLRTEIESDTSQAETKTDNLRTEIESDTSQAETKTDNLRTEIESDTSQAETKTDNLRTEIESDTSQAETKTDNLRTEIESDTSQAETKTDNLRTEIESDTSQAETKTDNLRTEIESDTSQAETKTDNLWTEIESDTSQAETKTDNLRTEIESDTSQVETKTDNLRTEIESDTLEAETKTDTSTYTTYGIKRVPLTEASHCNTEFQQLISEVGTSLAGSVETIKLKDFLQGFSHILYPETQYIDPSFLKDAEFVSQIFTALQPQIINFLNWGILWKAVDAFDIKVMPVFQSYTSRFPPHTKLSTLPDPLSEEEISGFKGIQKLRVTRGGGSRIEWTLSDVQAVREAVEKATGIDCDFIIYAYWEGGFTTHQFTFLIPKSISGIIGELCEEDLAILAGIGVRRLEVDYHTVADNIQELFKELPQTVAPVAEDNRMKTKSFGLEHFIPEDEMEQMSKEEFTRLNTLITSTPAGKLQETCSNDFLKVFAKKMGSWKDLAPYLGINQWDLEDLAEWYPRDEEEQKYVALITWKSIDVNSATYERLVECLLTHGHVDDAKELLLHFQGQYTHLCDHLYFN